MTSTTDLEARVAALEATVADLQTTVVAMRKLLAEKPSPSAPALRSLGMLDRPKTGR